MDSLAGVMVPFPSAGLVREMVQALAVPEPLAIARDTVMAPVPAVNAVRTPVIQVVGVAVMASTTD